MQIWLVLNQHATDSDFISGVETQVFGGFDGFIYKMETGNTFAAGSANNTILAVFRTPDMVMGDPGLRKYMQRVNLNYQGEGSTINASLALDMIMMIKIHHNQQK